MPDLRLATTGGELEVSGATREQLARRLGGLNSGRVVQLVLTEADGSQVLKLNTDAKRKLLAELSYWLDHPGPGGFPDDARALYRALAEELEPAPGRDAPAAG